MSSVRPVWWVSPVLYGAVLVAGGYASVAGLGSTRPLPFVGGLAALLALDLLERRHYPHGTPPRSAAGLLAARLGLFLVVVAADGSGLSRVLFLLLPFIAYFAFSRAVALVLGAGCVGLVLASYQLTSPGWYRELEPVSDLLMFGVGLVLTIAMASVAVEEQRGRARLEDYAARVSELSAAAERNRMARDIHDSLGHHLTAVSVLLEKSAAFRDLDPAVADRALDDARRSARRALSEVRESVRALREPAAPFRLSSALDELVHDADDGRLSVTLDVAGDEATHDTAALMALYRAAQEGVTNARRHAEATRVSVSVHCDGAAARLVVADDGRGFGQEREGFGLTGMRERVQLAGGSVDVDSRPGTGTRLTVTIPRRRVAP